MKDFRTRIGFLAAIFGFIFSNRALALQNNFPNLEDTLEMGILSLIVYSFKSETEDVVCPSINSGNYTSSIVGVPPEAFRKDLRCHWYRHDLLQGTQVMIVSSKSLNYIAVVFAGTNDITTALTDMDVLTTPYGNPNFTLPDEHVAIHSGFDNAIFSNDIFFEIDQRVNILLKANPKRRLFTTGHSLGAADAIILAVGLTYKYHDHRHSFFRAKRPEIKSITFGCPRIGNSYWRDFVHESPLVENLDIWRFVLGWDLVPRLPELMVHVGHTVEMTSNGWTTNATIDTYYQHYGDERLGYAGVPYGWSSTPFLWVPGALWSHHIHKYVGFLLEWRDFKKGWIEDFVHVSDVPDDDDRPPNVDDDFWVNPPDDPPILQIS